MFQATGKEKIFLPYLEAEIKPPINKSKAINNFMFVAEMEGNSGETFPYYTRVASRRSLTLLQQRLLGVLFLIIQKQLKRFSRSWAAQMVNICNFVSFIRIYLAGKIVTC